MVKTLLALVAVAGVANAGDRAIFGYRLEGGEVPIDHLSTDTVSVGLSAEHPIARRLSVFGEYDWIWLFRDKTDVMSEMRGDGQRAQVGARAQLKHATWDELDFYLDGELGAGFMLASDNMTGLHALPDAFAGVRAGYGFHARGGMRHATSNAFVFDLMLRIVRMPDGTGVTGGIGLAWQ